MIMKTKTTRLAGIAWLACCVTVPAATVTVDWLKLPSGSPPSGFQLMDDSSAPLAGGKLILTQGQSFLGTPSQRTLNASFWAGTTGFSDSVTGLADVSAISFRVAPVDGKASYEIELSVPAGRQLVLVVGDLFGNAAAWTTKVTITALSDSSSVPVTLAGMYGWDNGATSLSQALAWDQATGSLSTTSDANGDSKLAFLEIGPIAGLNPRLVLSIPEGYSGSNTGDSVVIGVGSVIPEPGIFALAGICGMLGLAMRHRR